MKIPFLKYHFFYLTDAKGTAGDLADAFWSEYPSDDRWLSGLRKSYDDLETVAVVDLETRAEVGSLTFLYVGKFKSLDEARDYLNEVREVVKPDAG